MGSEPSAFTKRIPSLAEWLGDDVRADGFEQWVALSLGKSVAELPPDEARFLRIAQTFSVACVEQMNREAAIDASPEAVSAALAMWSRAAGYVTIMAVASVAQDDAPFRRLARVFAEEFKIGAKLAADQLAGRTALGQSEGGADGR